MLDKNSKTDNINFLNEYHPFYYVYISETMEVSLFSYLVINSDSHFLTNQTSFKALVQAALRQDVGKCVTYWKRKAGRYDLRKC